MGYAAFIPASETPARTHPTGTRGPLTRPSGSRVRLTRRGRVVVGALVSLPFAALLVITGSVTADADTAGVSETASATIVVRAGENLWSIAKDVAPAADPRSTITRIRELNGLGNGPVVPGQSLVVPRGA